jgi:hypothetical protein
MASIEAVRSLLRVSARWMAAKSPMQAPATITPSDAAISISMSVNPFPTRGVRRGAFTAAVWEMVCMWITCGKCRRGGHR